MQRFWFGRIDGHPIAFASTADPTDPELVWEIRLGDDDSIIIRPADHAWSELATEELPEGTRILPG